ncbi:MAG: hypothetical protein KDD52_00370 [Bdellovibrionales bacterium]|nr:hypothetical protein [Bdellovibrionales bacterium]
MSDSNSPFWNHPRMFRLLFGCLCIFFLLLCFQNTPGVFTDQGVILNDSDPYYRLSRIESLTTQSISYPMKDPRLDYPTGFSVPWPMGLDYLLAMPMRFFGVKDRSSMAIFSSLSIPFLSLPILIAVVLSTLMLTNSFIFSLLAGLFICIFPFVRYQSGIGRIDHHFLEALLCGMSFMCVQWIQKKETWTCKALLILCLGLGPSFWPQAWIVGPMVFLAFLSMHSNIAFSTQAYLFLIAAFVHSFFLAFSQNFLSGTFSLFGFSWWTTILYLSIATILSILSLLKKEARSLRCFASSISTLSIASTFLLWKNGLFEMSREIQSTSQVLIRDTKHLSASTLEAKHLHLMSSNIWLHQGLYLIPLSCFSLILFSIKRKYKTLILYSLIPLALCWIQIRFVTMASTLVCIVATLLLHELFELLSDRSQRVRCSIVSILVLILAFPILPQWGWTRFSNSHPFFPSIFQFGRFVKAEQEIRVLSQTTNSVMAHWDYGHWLLYFTNFNVIAHPFQTKLSQKVTNLLVSKNIHALNRFAEKHDVQYLLTEFSPKRTHQWLLNSGQDPAPYIHIVHSPQGDHYQIKDDQFIDLNIAQFYFLNAQEKNGDHSKHWRLAFISPYGSPGYGQLTAMKAFERVKGARVRLKNASLDVSRIEAPIDYVYKKQFLFSQKPQRDGKDLLWIVPYAQYDRGGVRFDGYYYIKSDQGQVIAKVGPIQELEVLHGEELIVY